MNVFSCNFYNLIFIGSLYNIYPLDSFKCYTVAVSYLGLWTCVTGLLLYFVFKFKLLNFTTRDCSYGTPAYTSYATSSYSTASSLLPSGTSSVPFVSLPHCCQCALMLLSVSRTTSTAVSSPFPSNPSTRLVGTT